MIYKIKNEFLEVTSNCSIYNEYIFKRFSQFETISNSITSNYLKFNESTVEINLKDNYKILKNRIIKTDIYPIVNNAIAYLINDESNIFMHAIVISKGNKGILILGNFGQGKSTLAKEFVKNGYEVNSTDQTWLKMQGGILYQELGSVFDIDEGKIKLLERNASRKKIKIEKIIRIVGLCDNGKTTISVNNNKQYMIKNIVPFCYWNCMMPIFTDDIELYNTNIFVKKFWKVLDENKVSNYDVRGDKKQIVRKIGEM